MNRTKLPIRKRIGNVLQLSGSVQAAVAEEKAGPLVAFGDNNIGFTMGYDIVAVIDDVALIAGLEVNLLSVSQFADKGFKVLFNKEECTFINKKTGKVALI
ncbi:hypothetical protein AgCh_000104 [Apium graveolens]